MGEEAQEYVDTRLVQTQNDFEQSERDRPGVDEMIVELDGCFLRTAELVKKRGRGKTKVRKIQKKRRVEEYKEVRVGLVRSIDDVKKVAVAKMSGYPEICQQLFEASIEAGLSSKTQVVGIADGGNGLLEELQTHFPDMTFILDVFHLKENMYETADAMGFVEEEKEQWVKQRFSMIFKGKVEKALALMKEDLLKSGVNERLERLIGYIEKFKEGMSYKECKERGWPIGSGEVESAHRYIPQKRMKLPGAWWKKEHINPMLAMRVVRANGWWDSFWAEKDQLLEIAS
ncbi:MAG: hypothetical protein CL920_34820 [Deltaproteobacteria bacterium]|nr:hypothetical protein [Deltaproteobacteria bacterium]